MSVPQYVDISAFQPEPIDWKAYVNWAKSFDGVSRVAMRSSYGTGFTDTQFQAHRTNALAAGIDIIIFYHYAYPQYNAAIDEANYQLQVVGNIRPQDVLMLDMEENINQATTQWALDWLTQQEQNYRQLPTIYASTSYIQQYLQDNRLAKYPLTMANWQFTPLERPTCPPPWTSCTYLQYTDKATGIPGINTSVDANIFLGAEPMTHQQQSTLDHWNSFFITLQKVNTAVALAPVGTGIFNAWQSLYLQGKQLGSATSQEYDSIDWNGAAIKCQDFGSCRIEYYETTGIWHAYGPTGQLA